MWRVGCPFLRLLVSTHFSGATWPHPSMIRFSPQTFRTSRKFLIIKNRQYRHLSAFFVAVFLHVCFFSKILCGWKIGSVKSTPPKLCQTSSHSAAAKAGPNSRPAIFLLGGSSC